MKRFGYRLMSLVVVAGLLLSACAAPKAPSPAPAPERPSAAAPTPATPGTAQTREQKLIEAAKAAGEKEVVMWMYSWYHGPVEQAFEARYPFLKLKVSDLSVEVEPRMIEEYKAGKYSADVVGVPLRRAVRLKAAGVLQEYPFPNWPGTWPNQPKHNFWRQTTAAFYAPAYNTQMVALADAPRTWDDLTAARWRGNSIISTSGTAEILLGYAYMNGDLTASGIKWDNTVNFWKKVVDTVRPRVGAGFKQPLDLLVVGDVSLMIMAASSTGMYNIRRGAPITFAPIKQVPASSYALALAKNPSHSNAAQLLIDWLTSEEGNLAHANMFPDPSLHPEGAKRSLASQMIKQLGIEMVTPPSDILTDDMLIKADDLWIKDILKR